MRHLPPLRWCVVAVVLAVVLALPSLSGGAPANSDGLTAYFDPAEGNTPLDLFGVRFGQTASTDLTLIIRTHKPWETRRSTRASRRTLCILLRNDEQALPRRAGCAPTRARPRSPAWRCATRVLDPRPASSAGSATSRRSSSRPSKTTIRVTFPPALLRLKPGLYHWVARSQYRDDDDCPPPDGCEDLPAQHAARPTCRSRCRSPPRRASAASAPPRATSASRAATRKLARAVVPTPDDAVLTPNIPCTPAQADRADHPVRVRRAGAARRATRSRCIGDSHAAHWRAALEIVAQTFKWRGRVDHALGLPVHAGHRPPGSRQPPQACLRWNQRGAALAGRQPEDQHGLRRRALRRRRRRAAQGRRRVRGEDVGLPRAWQALPKSVKRVIVIRDTPKATPRHAELRPPRDPAAQARRARLARGRASGRSTATPPSSPPRGCPPSASRRST